MYYDRHIPASTPQQLRDSFALLDAPTTEKRSFESVSRSTFNQVLQNELLGSVQTSSPVKTFPDSNSQNKTPPSSPSRLFSYSRKTQPLDDSLYSLSPLGLRSQALLSSSKKPPRKIPKTPFKVLEAPSIQDDFYLNLVDWSCHNLLAVGLHQSVYLWNAGSGSVAKLCDMPGDSQVASVSWMGKGSHLAVGSNTGMVTLWDVNQGKQVRTFAGHKSRVGTLAWSNSPRWLLSSGSRDHAILNHDIRAPRTVAKLSGHKQEVCGLEWGYEPTSHLASGGNDNKLLVWEHRMLTSQDDFLGVTNHPLHEFCSHRAAVKAITWSPHQRGLLASGGGTADQRIRFWNSVTGQELSFIDTGSQVCNLSWSKNVNEIVSTHGYSQNHISVWHYPTMSEVVSLTGHTMRVLYLAVSPDGQTIVTGAGDETLRFWSLFPEAPSSPTQPILSTLNHPVHEIR